jgi:hypothetical protein
LERKRRSVGERGKSGNIFQTSNNKNENKKRSSRHSASQLGHSVDFFFFFKNEKRKIKRKNDPQVYLWQDEADERTPGTPTSSCRHTHERRVETKEETNTRRKEEEKTKRESRERETTRVFDCRLHW